MAGGGGREGARGRRERRSGGVGPRRYGARRFWRRRRRRMGTPGAPLRIGASDGDGLSLATTPKVRTGGGAPGTEPGLWSRIPGPASPAWLGSGGVGALAPRSLPAACASSCSVEKRPRSDAGGGPGPWGSVECLLHCGTGNGKGQGLSGPAGHPQRTLCWACGTGGSPEPTPRDVDGFGQVLRERERERERSNLSSHTRLMQVLPGHALTDPRERINYKAATKDTGATHAY